MTASSKRPSVRDIISHGPLAHSARARGRQIDLGKTRYAALNPAHRKDEQPGSGSQPRGGPVRGVCSRCIEHPPFAPVLPVSPSRPSSPGPRSGVRTSPPILSSCRATSCRSGRHGFHRFRNLPVNPVEPGQDPGQRGGRIDLFAGQAAGVLNEFVNRRNNPLQICRCFPKGHFRRCGPLEEAVAPLEVRTEQRTVGQSRRGIPLAGRCGRFPGNTGPADTAERKVASRSLAAFRHQGACSA